MSKYTLNNATGEDKRLDQIQPGDMVKLPHSEALWYVLATEESGTHYLIVVRGAEPHKGAAGDTLPCYTFPEKSET